MTDTCLKIASKWSDNIHLKTESKSTTGLFLTLQLSVLACCNIFSFWFQLLPVGNLWKKRGVFTVPDPYRASSRDKRVQWTIPTTIFDQQVLRKAGSALDCTNQPLHFQFGSLPSVPRFKCSRSKNSFVPCAITLFNLHMEFNILEIVLLH